MQFENCYIFIIVIVVGFTSNALDLYAQEYKTNESEYEYKMTGMIKEISLDQLVVQNENGVFKFVMNKSKFENKIGAQVGEQVTVEYTLTVSKFSIQRGVGKVGRKQGEGVKPEQERPFEHRIEDDRIFYETKNKLPGTSVAKAACRRTKNSLEDRNL